MRVVHRMAEALRDGDVLAVFPEGTTSDGTGMLPFHANLLQAALSASAPVQPVALDFMDAAAGAVEGDHMVHLGANADPFADLVVVVAGHMGHHRLAAGQAQRVEELRAAKRLAHDLRLHRCVVVVHDVVGAQQHVALPPGKRGQGAFGHVGQFAQRGLHHHLLPRCTSVAGANTPWPMKSATKRVAGRW
jgi:hypothetical protein